MEEEKRSSVLDMVYKILLKYYIIYIQIIYFDHFGYKRKEKENFFQNNPTTLNNLNSWK